MSVDQIFAVGQVCEECLAEGNDVYWEFIAFEKAADKYVEMRCGMCGFMVWLSTAERVSKYGMR